MGYGQSGSEWFLGVKRCRGAVVWGLLRAACSPSSALSGPQDDVYSLYTYRLSACVSGFAELVHSESCIPPSPSFPDP